MTAVRAAGYTARMPAPFRARCPTCKEPVAVHPRERPADFPFCSERCRLVDLHRWLQEEYRIPVREPPPADREETGPPAPAEHA